MNKRSLPTRWPLDIEYIQARKYAPDIPAEIIAEIRGPKATNAKHPPTSATVIIRLIGDPSHPAYGQRGLFAAKKIPPRSHILDYLGEVHIDNRPDSDYDLSLYRSPDGTINVGIDASQMGNSARFVNDFRGVKPKANALFKDERNSSGELRMSVWSDCDIIKKGEEILVSYGKAWWRARSSEASVDSG